MKPSLALVLFATACFASGCSSSPLTGSPEESDVPVAAAGSPTVGAAGSSAAGSAGGPAVAGPTSSAYALYPAGPYGTGRGAHIANLTFLGWKHPDAAAYDPKRFETVRLSDFYDPEGTSGIKLLAINASAVWCSVCRSEYEDMNTNDTYATYRAKGVEFLGTLFEDNSYYPAQPADLKTWGSVSTHAVKFPLVLDPSFKMGAYFDSDATPLNMLVDVRTMTIVSVTMGYSTTYWASVQTILNGL
jgi:AhpC/TSA family